jgi:hypothetical protein
MEDRVRVLFLWAILFCFIFLRIFMKIRLSVRVFLLNKTKRQTDSLTNYINTEFSST